MKPLPGKLSILLCAVGFVAEMAAAQTTLWTFPQAVGSNATTDTGDDSYPDLATDGAGNWVAVWQSNDSLSGTIGTDFDILTSRSGDDGATWTAPVPLNGNAAIDTGADHVPDICTDGAGLWIAAWHSTDSLGGVIGVDVDILVVRSTDNGATWTLPVPLNSNAAIDGEHDYVPKFATNRSGRWVAVWSAYYDVNSTYDRDIFVSRSTDGESWTPQAPLNANATMDSGEDFNPQIATDDAGNWIAVWESSDSLGNTTGTDYDILVSRSTSDGLTWTAPVPLHQFAASDSATDIEPYVATDRDGTWIAVWRSSESFGGVLGNDYDILASRSIDNGATWTAPLPVNSFAATDNSTEFHPQLVNDGAGLWVAMYPSSNTLSGTIGFDLDVLVSRSTDNGASWSPAMVLNTNATTDSSTDEYPKLITDGNANWIAVWRSNDTLGGTIGSDYDILFARATDTDADAVSDSNETTNGTDPNNADSDQDLLDDGEEPTLYSTDPLNPDTDGDGVLDGIEIDLGTDPNDPFDFPILPLTWLWVAAGGAVIILAATAARRSAAKV